MESRASHDETESFQTDPAFADVVMAIYSRTAACLRIVYVNCNKAIPRLRDDAIEFVKCFPHTRFAADLVTRGEEMRRVEAHAQPIRLAHVRDDVREMLESMTDARTLAGCNLER
ncbi:MAG TPA: hypothetical protein VN825_03150, partial [Candidatus Acidoferrum sp.]|nr:hypothetical protein [Candidatus Acidoferrum sp.]